MRNILFKGLIVGLLSTASARAGTATFDLNTQPTTEFVMLGSAAWEPTGGLTNSGFIKLTDDTGQTCAVLFPDFDQGLVVKAFTFDCMIKMGDWYANSPADGFSVNYARSTDPIISLIESGTDPGRGSTTDGWAGSQDNGGTEIDLPEEGTQTGIGIGFDTWGTGSAPVGGSNGARDVRGISVRVEGVQETQVAMPDVLFADGDNHDYANDATTLVTGPFSNGGDTNAGAATVTIGTVTLPAYGNPDNGDGTTAPPALGKKLNWVPLRVAVDENGILNVFWKGSNIVHNLQTSYGPGPGRIVFGASTGGAMEFAGIDNITITTIPSDVALVSIARSLPGANGFSAIVNDSGQSVVDTSAPMSIKLDGNAITPTSVTKVGAATTIVYILPAPQYLTPGSSHTVDVDVKDTRGVDIIGTKTFTASTYPITTVPAAVAVTGVDTTKPGFKVRPIQTTGQLEGAQPNDLWWTEDQLLGLRGTNTANLTQTLDGQPVDANGYYTISNVINWDGVELSRMDGHFNDNNGYPEIELPGMPPANASATAGDYNSLSEEVLTFLHFPAAGVYTMGVNSDDGFKVTTGRNPKDAFALNLGQFNGGRGASDTLFNVVILQPGDYPFRLIWENGGGGANCEWFTVNPNGSRVLINDPAGTNSTIKAYWSGPALPAYVSRATPPPYSGTRPDAVVSAQLTDGSTAVASATLSFNGAAPVSGSKSGNVTTITIPSNALLASGSTNNVSLVWSDTGSPAITATNPWTFTVLTYDNNNALPTDLASPIGSGDATKPGFTVQANQVDDTNGDTENNNVATESQLAGLYGPNIATLSGTGWLSNDLFAVTTYINWDRGASDGSAGEDGNFTSGNGFPEQEFPGITTSSVNYNSIAEGVQTYVEFPAVGFYQMGVNSDDNFRVTVGESAPPAVLKISGPTNTALPCLSMSQLPGEQDVSGNRATYGAPPPKTPITAPIVYLTPGGINDPGPYPDVTGKIALLDRSGSNLGTGSTGGKCKAAQTAGAVAVIFTTPGNLGYGGYAGATRTDITIPCLCIPDSPTANMLRNYLTNGVSVTGTISGDTNYLVGGFNAGRGSSDTLMNFLVSQAGVYPMRMIFHQGGGGANCEWFTVKPSGTKVLVNDTANGGLKAYRTRTFVPPPKFNPTTISAGTVTISWTGAGTLQQATVLTGSPSDWSDVNNPPPTGNSYTVSAGTSGNKFFRLKR